MGTLPNLTLFGEGLCLLDFDRRLGRTPTVPGTLSSKSDRLLRSEPCNHTGSPSSECVSADIVFHGRTSMAVEIMRDCMGKSLDHWARIFTNKMGLQCTGLLYLCLLLIWAASGVISVTFVHSVLPSKKNRGVPHRKMSLKWPQTLPRQARDTDKAVQCVEGWSYSWKSLLGDRVITPLTISFSYLNRHSGAPTKYYVSENTFSAWAVCGNNSNSVQVTLWQHVSHNGA